MNKYHVVEDIRLENGYLKLVVDGSILEKPLSEISSTLSNATPDEQQRFEISPSGYGIHWPLIDEDISIDGLLGIEHKPISDRKSA